MTIKVRLIYSDNTIPNLWPIMVSFKINDCIIWVFCSTAKVVSTCLWPLANIQDTNNV